MNVYHVPGLPFKKIIYYSSNTNLFKFPQSWSFTISNALDKSTKASNTGWGLLSISFQKYNFSFYNNILYLFRHFISPYFMIFSNILARFEMSDIDRCLTPTLRVPPNLPNSKHSYCFRMNWELEFFISSDRILSKPRYFRNINSFMGFLVIDWIAKHSNIIGVINQIIWRGNFFCTTFSNFYLAFIEIFDNFHMIVSNWFMLQFNIYIFLWLHYLFRYRFCSREIEIYFNFVDLAVCLYFYICNIGQAGLGSHFFFFSTFNYIGCSVAMTFFN